MTPVGFDDSGNKLWQLELEEYPVILIADPRRKLFITEDLDEHDDGTGGPDDRSDGDV